MAEKSQIQYIWKQIRDKAENLIAPVSFVAFIKDLEPTQILNRKIVLKAPTDLAASTIMNKHAASLRSAIEKSNVSGITDFQLVVQDSKIYNLDNADEEFDEPFNPIPLNKNYTFDSFVVGQSNKFVYAAAKAVAETPGTGFNPLFIYGESGLGKTHLLHAIANQMAQTAPKKRVLFTSCDNFVTEFIDAMIAGKMNQSDKSARFRNHYRNVDILMIDDIQFLAKRPGVQEEFFNTFNELYSMNKQIVLTSDKPPKEIATLEERLRTRFEGGLIADIQPPDTETKIAILKRKAVEKKCPVIPKDVLEYLASGSGHDVRMLEGRLNKVLFASKLHELPIDLDLAKLALSESVPREGDEQEELSPESVFTAVCGYYKIKKEEIVGKSKKADIVKARQVCAYLMCEVLSLPLISIGKVMGGRDHTTVMYSRDKVEEQMRLNEKFSKEVEDVKSIIYKK